MPPHTHALQLETGRCSVCALTLDQLVHVMLYGHYHTARWAALLCRLLRR